MKCDINIISYSHIIQKHGPTSYICGNPMQLAFRIHAFTTGLVDCLADMVLVHTNGLLTLQPDRLQAQGL